MLARETNGAVFQVTEADELADVAKAHRLARWSLKDVRVDGGHDVLVHGGPRDLYPGQTIYVAGRGRPAAGATVDLIVESSAGIETVLRVPVARGFDTELATSTYGQIAVETLEGLGPVVADTARAYALHFRQVGTTCSLLMLDSERDYRRFGIEPEKDSEVVRLTRTRELLRRARREHHDTLLDPKARFLAWLDELAREDADAKLPKAVRAWADELPAHAFAVEAETVRCAARTRDALGDRPTGGVAAHERIAAHVERRHGAADALRYRSAAVEENPGDPVVARGTAFVARALGFPGHAHHLLTRALRARPFEAHGYLAVASCLADAGRPDLARIHYELAWRLARTNRTVAVHYLRFLARAGDRYDDAWTRARRAELADTAGFTEADLVITLAWNTDRTDVDLHVTDPTKETCNYGNTETRLGGQMTQDIQGGYGPEMFTLPTGRPGTYVVQANMFRSDTRRQGTNTRIWLTTVEDWGRPTERVRHAHFLLGDAKKLVTLDEVRRGAP